MRMFESDRPYLERFMAAGHEPALNGIGQVDEEWLDERAETRFGARCRLCGLGLDLGSYGEIPDPMPACDGAEGLARRLRARRDHYERLAADLDLQAFRAVPSEHAVAPAHQWLYSGSPHPRGVAEDVVRLAVFMAAGRVRGLVVAVLRDDGVVESKVVGDVAEWLPRTLRSLAVQEERRRVIEARADAAMEGVERPPRGDAPLTERQARWLADELRRVLREVESGACS